MAKAKKIKLTQAELKTLLEYDPDTGIFYFIAKTAIRVKIGDIAGCKTVQGYIRINILGESYFAHRLAWLYVYGEEPSIDIDHINHNRADNRISNLRLATMSDNMKNRQMNKRREGKEICIYERKRKKPFQVSVMGNYIGSYKTLTEAIYARDKEFEKHDFHPNHGKDMLSHEQS